MTKTWFIYHTGSRRIINAVTTSSEAQAQKVLERMHHADKLTLLPERQATLEQIEEYERDYLSEGE